jgi:hypothetical protein
MTQDPPPWPRPDSSPTGSPAPDYLSAGYPPAGYPPAGYLPAGHPPAGGRSTGTDGFAVTSVVLGALGGGLVAIGFGWAALRRIRRTGRSGRSLAVTGIVMSIGWMVIGAAIAGVVIRSSRSGAGSTSSSSASRVTSGQVALSALRVGDCVKDDLGSGEARMAGVVPCTQAHHGEVFSVGRATGVGAYPGDSAVRTQAEQLCNKAVPANLVSDLPTGSELLYSYPKSPGWLSGDRAVTCLVNIPGATSTVELVNAAAR